MYADFDIMFKHKNVLIFCFSSTALLKWFWKFHKCDSDFTFLQTAGVFSTS